MTAIEDFVAAHGEAVRLVVLPILFGLAIVVDEQRLTSQPSLAAALDRLENLRHGLPERGGEGVA
jgi:hypothetical protein